MKTRLAALPTGISWGQVYGLAVLCGIGFTMSLFIGSLAFEGSGGPNYAVDARVGILAGSFLSAVVGVVVLLLACKGPAERGEEPLDGGIMGPRKEIQDPTNEEHDPVRCPFGG